MDFDFLPRLPKSDLDDRTFQDLVEECILRIPRYCPEWTNYNPGDPGITLVELFAWLTDQMMMRFNQVPRRQYVAFLEMLGVRLQPPSPAHTEVTFYLTSTLPTRYAIATGTEVATLRTETEEAIVFSTDRPLWIGVPRINHFLTAERVENEPQVLRDRFTNQWSQASDGTWEGREQFVFDERPKDGNCFYLVFSPDEPLDGNVLALTLQGQAATATGINPDQPPRDWEAWDGMAWRSILLQESDDHTKGFSFSEHGNAAPNQVQSSDVVLHLPLDWPVTDFATYRGRWLRCVCRPGRSSYSRSPQLMGMSVRAIGGVISASQCLLIRDELLGESNGTPGQMIQLQSGSVLPRQTGEHLIVTSPVGLPQIWQEVTDFADSGPDDRHYVLDSLSGSIQFGPLIREPGQLRQQVSTRSRTQQQSSSNSSTSGNSNGSSITIVSPTNESLSFEQSRLERQYGNIPPRGSTFRMAAYRTGGGAAGNVQKGSIFVLKSAVPYVDRVVNHGAAYQGADAESLEEAVLRVPQLLRTRDRAITPEDFETLSLQAGRGAIARAYCPVKSQINPGIVDVRLVPQINPAILDRGEGINPSQLALTPQLRSQVLNYLDERRLVGVQVRLQEPEYVGVSVQVEVGLHPEYTNPQAQLLIMRKLQMSLYRFLNPLTGGSQGKGWDIGSPVYRSDIVNLIQQTSGVRFLGEVLLFEIRRSQSTWFRSLATGGAINPGDRGLICSWADDRLRTSHTISLIV
ncbi:MAG: putative baseplate assembly protein [Cyanobacteria bacterium]|nr:putative baseplate assembly protein [Cyanobacteriota bacterium]